MPVGRKLMVGNDSGPVLVPADWSEGTAPRWWMAVFARLAILFYTYHDACPS